MFQLQRRDNLHSEKKKEARFSNAKFLTGQICNMDNHTLYLWKAIDTKFYAWPDTADNASFSENCRWKSRELKFIFCRIFLLAPKLPYLVWSFAKLQSDTCGVLLAVLRHIKSWWNYSHIHFIHFEMKIVSFLNAFSNYVI